MIVGRGQHEFGLYILERCVVAFITELKIRRLRASFELWHAHLGHVAYDIVSLLNKQWLVSVTSILPKPTICESCQLPKSERLIVSNNDKCVVHVLDLVNH